MNSSRQLDATNARHITQPSSMLRILRAQGLAWRPSRDTLVLTESASDSSSNPCYPTRNDCSRPGRPSAARTGKCTSPSALQFATN